MDQIYFFRIISRLQCVLSFFQEKPASFDRNEDFRNNFQEEQRSDNAPNGWQKQDRTPHDRVAGPEAAHDQHGQMHDSASATLHSLVTPRAI